MFTIASYDGNQLISVDTKYINVASGTAASSLTLNNVATGNTVRAFVWAEDLAPIANDDNFTTIITVQ
jgi:hypothetical protein